jgi:hypothetical protein
MNSKIEDLYLECIKNTFPSYLLDILNTRGLSKFIGLAKIVQMDCIMRRKQLASLQHPFYSQCDENNKDDSF